MHMTRWPTLKQVVCVWAVLTTLALVACIFHLRGLPHDELVMENPLGFQAAVGILFVVPPATALLLLFLVLGAVAKPWLLRSTRGRREHGD